MPDNTTDGAGSNNNNVKIPFQNLKRDTTFDEPPSIDGNMSVRQWMKHLIGK
tara:strand:+ start:179 stop:334 length:156 start_codon:yes stop_codon:yes gene_type:complete